MTNKNLTQMFGWGLIVSLLINLNFFYVYVIQAPPSSEYVKYQPIFFDKKKVNSIESDYMIDGTKIDEEHIKYLIEVLEINGIDYKVKFGSLMIKKQLWENKGDLASITNKAIEAATVQSSSQ
jgi:hypothetical protein